MDSYSTFHGIPFPNKLLEALDSNRLILFLGAGISFPSEFPDFDTLAKRVAIEYKCEIPHIQDDPALEIFNTLHSKGFDIQLTTKTIIRNLGKSYNSLHNYIIRLFVTSDINIITTNYDNYLEEAAKELGIAVNSNDYTDIKKRDNISCFPCIMHIHGNAFIDESRLMLSRNDLYDIYHENKPGRIFLEDIFLSGYYILFIGYSCRDEGLYDVLFRNAKLKSNLYILTYEHDKYQSYDLNPIDYDLVYGSNEHIQVEELLEGLVTYRENNAGMAPPKVIKQTTGIVEIKDNMDLLTKARDNKELAIKINRLEVIDKDTVFAIEKRLEKTSDLPLLLEYAEGIIWLKSLFKAGIFDKYFSNKLTDWTNYLSRWLALKYSFKFRDELIFLWSLFNFKPNESLENWIRSVLFSSRSEVDEDTEFIWHYILDQKGGFNGEYYKTFEYADYTQDDAISDPQYALSIFNQVFKPRVSFGRKNIDDIDDEDSIIGFRKTISLRFYSNQWRAEKFWGNLKKKLNVIDLDMLMSCINNLEISHRIMKIFKDINDTWDNLSIDMTSIEPSDQNFGFNELIILVNIARECIDNIIITKRNTTRDIIEKLLCSVSPTVRRLAVYAMWKNKSTKAEMKINWVIKNDLLNKSELHHEIFMLLKDEFVRTTEQFQSKFIKRILELMASVKDDHELYNYFNILVWIRELRPKDSELIDFLEQIKAKFNFEERDHPEYLMWHGEMRRVESPFAAEDLSKFSMDELKEKLYHYPRGFKDSWGFGDRVELCRELEKSVASDFNWSWNLVETLLVEKRWQSDIWAAIFEGWSKIDLTLSQWRKILSLIEDLLAKYSFEKMEESKEWHTLQEELSDISQDKFSELKSTDNWLYSMTRFLNDSVEKKKGSLPFQFLERAELIATKLWPRVEKYQSSWDKKEFPNIVFNHPAGMIAQFWVKSLYRRYNKDKANFKEIPENHKSFILRVINVKKPCEKIAFYWISANSRNILCFEKEWADLYIIPTFNWANEQVSEIAWSAITRFVEWNWYPNFYNSVLPFMDQTYVNMRKNDEDKKALIKLFTQFFLVYEYIRVKSWFESFILEASKEDLAQFAEDVDRYIIQERFKNKPDLWTEKIKPYLEKRLEQTEKTPNEDELLNFYRWLLELKPNFPEFSKILMKFQALGDAGFIYLHLEHKDFTEAYPNEVYQLTIFLLEHAEPEKAGSSFYHIKKLAEALKNNGIDQTSIDVIKENMLRLGVLPTFIDEL